MMVYSLSEYNWVFLYMQTQQRVENNRNKDWAEGWGGGDLW